MVREDEGVELPEGPEVPLGAGGVVVVQDDSKQIRLYSFN